MKATLYSVDEAVLFHCLIEGSAIETLSLSNFRQQTVEVYGNLSSKLEKLCGDQQMTWKFGVRKCVANLFVKIQLKTGSILTTKQPGPPRTAIAYTVAVKLDSILSAHPSV